MMRSSSGDASTRSRTACGGPRPLDHFVEHQTEAPDVGAVIHGLAAGLLRRHVGGCSHHDALPRAGHRGHVRLRCG